MQVLPSACMVTESAVYQVSPCSIFVAIFHCVGHSSSITASRVRVCVCTGGFQVCHAKQRMGIAPQAHEAPIPSSTQRARGA